MIGTPSFSQPYLYIQPTPQSPQKTRSSTSVNSHVAITPLLVHKSSLQSPLTIPCFIPLQFLISIFLRATIPTIYSKNISLSQPFVRRLVGTLVRTDSSSLRFRKLIYCRCGKPSNLPFFIPSTYCHYFHNLLIPSQELKPKTSDFS